MEHGQEIVTLSCFPDHQFHAECYDDFVKHFEAQNQNLVCPLCRRPVEKDKVKKEKLQIVEQAKAKDLDQVAQSNPKEMDDMAHSKQNATQDNLIISAPIPAPELLAQPNDYQP